MPKVSASPETETTIPQLEDRVHHSRCHLALLEKLAELGSCAETGGTDPERDQEAWQAVEMIVGQARTTLQAVFDAGWEASKKGVAR